VLTPVIGELEKSGHLETRVKAHLQAFYASSEVATVLENQ
jgi:hypothetical protein